MFNFPLSLFVHQMTHHLILALQDFVDGLHYSARVYSMKSLQIGDDVIKLGQLDFKWLVGTREWNNFGSIAFHAS